MRLAGAGVPPVEALSVVAEDAQPPVAPVLREVCDALLAGLDVDRALRMTSERVRLAEFTLFAAVLRLQRRAGGGISGAFANLAETLRERNKTALKGPRLHRADPAHAARALGDAGGGADRAEVHRARIGRRALRHRAGNDAPSGRHRAHRHRAAGRAGHRRAGGALGGAGVTATTLAWLAVVLAAGTLVLAAVGVVVYRETQRTLTFDRRLGVPRRLALGAGLTSGRRERRGGGADGWKALGRALVRAGSLLAPVGAAEREKLGMLLRASGFGQRDALSVFLSVKFAAALAAAAGAGIQAAGTALGDPTASSSRSRRSRASSWAASSPSTRFACARRAARSGWGRRSPTRWTSR